jgi:tetratricopeptide (TPR) repeat protein
VTGIGLQGLRFGPGKGVSFFCPAAASERVNRVEKGELDWALLYRDLHRDDDAHPLLERALAAYEKAAPLHPKLAIILRNLAELEADQGNLERSGQLFSRALRICDVSLPPDHPQTAFILQAYGRFLVKSGRKREARVATDRARTILAKGARENGTVYTIDVSSFLHQ